MYLKIISAWLLLILFNSSKAQTITGVWKGRINKQKVEVKIIQKGDSLTGTSYYQEAGGQYRRYSIKGYFDQFTNAVTWWDDQLLESKGSSAGKNPMLSIADFNCPGGGKMLLEGNAANKQDPSNPKGSVDLSKTGITSFPDEWDFVLDNYTRGGNDPDLIDSIDALKFIPRQPEVILVKNKQKEPALPPAKRGMVIIPPMPSPEKAKTPDKTSSPVKIPSSLEEKFVSRKNIFTREIPVSGDSIELRFYDNAEVDGDSISLFVNKQLYFKHIRLSGQPYAVKLALSDLGPETELVMVAENLGTIPPNTAYMLAIVNDTRYEVYLTSTEETSAMIRFRKE